jgi:UDP-glucose 4-epimerase
MNILVTGGTGYIGSHTVVELLDQNHTVTIVDNLSNSTEDVISRIAKITGVTVPLHVFNVEDTEKLDALFSKNSFDAVIHFAGLKAVGESVEKPLLYYRTNLDSSLALLEAMKKHTVKILIFSSSATVYGNAPVPYHEESTVGQGITNSYGQTKYVIEQFMRDEAIAQPEARFTSLRYFNPVGAHESGLIGERPNGIPNNLMPYIAQVASGEREKLSVFGNDYSTVDGTGVRDYIHVVDLAKGHVAALGHTSDGFSTYNLGSGKGTSVLQLVEAFSKACGRSVAYEFAPRRAGDIAESYADVSKAEAELGWKTEKTIDDMCIDTWRWQQNSINS